jgi:hypothetical protein
VDNAQKKGSNNLIFKGSWERLRRNRATILFLRGRGQGSEVREQQFDFYGVVGKAQKKGSNNLIFKGSWARLRRNRATI